MSTKEFKPQVRQTPDWSSPTTTLTREQLNKTGDDIDNLINNTEALNDKLEALIAASIKVLSGTEVPSVEAGDDGDIYLIVEE